MRSPHRSLATVFTAVLLGGGIALASAVPAEAHDELLSSYPETGSTITGSPDEITLTFSGELLDGMQSAVIEVIDPNSQNIAADAPSVVDTSITQHLNPDPPDGTFIVRWKVVSSDGHPISGEYTYTVQTLTTEAATVSPTPGPTLVQETPEPTPSASGATVVDRSDGDGRGTSGGGDLLPIAAVFAGVVVLGGTLAVVLMVARERRRRDRAEARNAPQHAVTDAEDTNRDE